MPNTNTESGLVDIDVNSHRFPHCIVWTPIPILTWILPFVGHMGIATSRGIIRDFAGPYYVSEDNMGFGWPTRYWQLRLDDRVNRELWDRSVFDASEVYKGRMHNLCCDNCHSHVAMALNMMSYDGSTQWNMFKLTFLMLFKGSYVSFGAFLKTCLPFMIWTFTILFIILYLRF